MFMKLGMFVVTAQIGETRGSRTALFVVVGDGLKKKNQQNPVCHFGGSQCFWLHIVQVLCLGAVCGFEVEGGDGLPRFLFCQRFPIYYLVALSVFGSLLFKYLAWGPGVDFGVVVGDGLIDKQKNQQ